MTNIGKGSNLTASVYALAAACFYAINVPLSKLLLDSVSPTVMTALLYLGAGLVLGHGLDDNGACHRRRAACCGVYRCRACHVEGNAVGKLFCGAYNYDSRHSLAELERYHTSHI